MQSYRFSNPSIVVYVSKSPLNISASKSIDYIVFDCQCKPFGNYAAYPKRRYTVRALTMAQAARYAVDKYAKEFVKNGK